MALSVVLVVFSVVFLVLARAQEAAVEMRAAGSLLLTRLAERDLSSPTF